MATFSTLEELKQMLNDSSVSRKHLSFNGRNLIINRFSPLERRLSIFFSILVFFFGLLFSGVGDLFFLLPLIGVFSLLIILFSNRRIVIDHDEKLLVGTLLKWTIWKCPFHNFSHLEIGKRVITENRDAKTGRLISTHDSGFPLYVHFVNGKRKIIAFDRDISEIHEIMRVFQQAMNL